MKPMFQKFLRKLKPSLLSLWGGTLLSSGLSIFVGVVGLPSAPSFLWMLLLGALLVTVSGILVFLSALRLETSLTVFENLPGNVSIRDVDQLWASSFEQHGGAVLVRLLSGCAFAIVGSVLLLYRIVFAFSSQNLAGK
jgi:hypothetical protein